MTTQTVVLHNVSLLKGMFFAALSSRQFDGDFCDVRLQRGQTQQAKRSPLFKRVDKQSWLCADATPSIAFG
jgi:hypothetical protein